MSPAIVTEPVTQGLWGAQDSSLHQHTHQVRLLHSPTLPFYRRNLWSQEEICLRSYNHLGFPLQWSQCYQTIPRYFLCLLRYVMSYQIKDDIHLCVYTHTHTLYSFTYDHYLLTHFQHDRRLVFSGVGICPHSLTHSEEGCLEGSVAMHTGVETAPQKLNFPQI